MKLINFKEEIGYFKTDFDLKHIKKQLYKLKKKLSDSDGYSNVGGWQKEITDIKEFNFLKERIIRHFIDYYLSSQTNFINVERAERNLKIHIPKLFCNINPTNAYHGTHAHNGGQFSGVIWLQADKKSGNIILHNPMPSNDLWSLYPNFENYDEMSLTISNTEIKPKPNTGIIFNSKILHHVAPNLSKEDRISISFHIYVNDTSLLR